MVPKSNEREGGTSARGYKRGAALGSDVEDRGAGTGGKEFMIFDL